MSRSPELKFILSLLIFRELLAVVVKPMLKQLLSARVTWSSVSLRNLEQGSEWHELLSRGADTDSLP